MGWLSVENKDGRHYYGDECLDACADFLQTMTREFEQEWQRKPTVAEIMLCMEITLGSDLGGYSDGGESLDLVSIAAKTKARPSKPKVQPGDILAIPFKPGTYGFAQVLEVDKKMMGLIGIYPLKSETRRVTLSKLADLSFAGYEQGDLAPVSYCHWQVIGNLPIPDGTPKLTDWAGPGAMEIAVIDALKKIGDLAPNFLFFFGMGCATPKFRESYRDNYNARLDFLEEKGLLTEEGRAFIGKVDDSFSMHTDLLTEEGVAFYLQVHRAQHRHKNYKEDTAAKLQLVWDEFKG